MPHKPDKHYRWGPSSSSRWIVCPYSAQPDLPESPNEHTIRGNDLHETSAYVFADGLPLFGNSPDVESVRAFVSFAQALPGDKQYETRFVSAIIPDHGGTVDVLAVTDDTLHVVDAKFGKWKVTARANTQLGCYLNLAREQFPDRKHFKATIVQPACFKKPQTAEFSAAWLDEHLGKVIYAATHPHLKATGEHCFFCPLRKAGQCSEGEWYGESRGWAQ